MASLGTLGRLTNCPRCKGRNAVVWWRDADGRSGRCLHCGWQGYADSTAGMEGSGVGGRGGGSGSRRAEAEEEPVAVSSRG